jgi:hypothetical protein
LLDSLRADLSASLTIYRWQSAAKSVPQRVTAYHRAHPTLANQKNAQGAPPSIFRVDPEFSWTIQRSFLGVANLAVEPRDSSGTGIQFFLLLLMPASAWAAIPRTNNPLQACNSWLHRNEHTAFP